MPAWGCSLLSRSPCPGGLAPARRSAPPAIGSRSGGCAVPAGSMTDTRRRVKVYTLNEDRQWDDRGTGHVSSCYVERLKGMSLLVRAESDGKCVRLKVRSLLVLPWKGAGCSFVSVALVFCCGIQVVLLKASSCYQGSFVLGQVKETEDCHRVRAEWALTEHTALHAKCVRVSL